MGRQVGDSLSIDGLSFGAASPVGIVRTDKVGVCTEVNDRYCEILGLARAALIDQPWSVGYRPEDRERIVTAYEQARQENQPWSIECRIHRPDGSDVWVYGQLAVESNAAGAAIGYIGTIIDISDRKRTEALLESQYEILARIAQAEPLSHTLDALMRAMEAYLPETVCTIMLSRDGQLGQTSAPSLPPDYVKTAVLAIAEGVGTCGTAAYRREITIVADIATDPLCQDYKQLALAHGLQSCWSVPILTSDQTLLGVFGIYYRQKKTPQPHELACVSKMCHIARLAIEQAQTTQTLHQLNQALEQRVAERTTALQASEERWQLAFHGSKASIWDWDLHHNLKFYSRGWKQNRGYRDDEISDAVEECFSRIHPDDYARSMATIAAHLAGETEFFELEYRSRHKDGSYIWVLERGQAVRDSTGQVVRMIGSETVITDRKQAELALQKSENLYATLAELSPVAICRFDAPMNCVYVSDRWSEMTGRPVESALGQGWLAAIHPDDLERLLAPWENNAPQFNPDPPHAIQGIEGRHLRPDGSINWFYVQARTEFDAQGQICGCISTLTDITQLKQIEAELAASEAKYRRLVEGGQDVIWALDRQWRFTYLSPQFQSLSGWEASEWLDRSCLEAVHPDDRETVLAHYTAHSQPPTKTATEFRMCHRDRPYVWVRISSTPILDVTGELVGYQGVLTDITDRKQIEAALSASEAKYRQLVEGGQDLIWSIDAQDRFTYLSPQFKPLFGWEPREWIGRTSLEAVYPDDRDWLVQQRLSPAIITKQTYLEFRHCHRDRPYIWVRVSSTPVFDTTGKWIGYQGSLTDISDRKQAEAQLQLTNEELLRATRLKDEFLANMSHELRTPLNAILGLSEALQDQIVGLLNERQLKMVRTIERSGEHLLALINDILDVAKIESGQITLTYVPIDIALLCQSSLAFIQQQAIKKRIQLDIQLPPSPLPSLYLDDRRIRQVLINLLNNAVKFTPEGGCITVKVLAPWELGAPQEATPAAYPMFQLSVTDTGIGIAPENIPKLFQPFVQIDGALNRQYTGTGLGLALVKRIVELHGGEVGLTSELGVGSCFTMMLPYHPLETVHATVPTTPTTLTTPIEQSNISTIPAPNTGIKILLAEDDAANIATIVDYLEIMGYSVFIAHNGQAAIELTQTLQPDLVLMDIQMPGMDGLEAMRQLRQIPACQDIPIIALTALAMPGDEARCLNSGATDYLSKPVRLKTLNAKIRSCLAD